MADGGRFDGHFGQLPLGPIKDAMPALAAVTGGSGDAMRRS
ncbi:MAG: hypothetical protein ACLSDO_00650 [Anaerotruncus colihominis]